MEQLSQNFISPLIKYYDSDLNALKPGKDNCIIYDLKTISEI